MIRKNLKIVICVFLLGIFMGTSAVAFATEIEGDWSMFPVDDIFFKNRSKIISDFFLGVYGYTWVETEYALPAGYIGASAYLYESPSGIMRLSSGVKYTTTSTNWLSQATGYRNVSGTYYSKGNSLHFTSGGYVTKGTVRTPNLVY